ncbi:MAG: hypothetical protein ICV84_21975, partial [Flavisolibacter sp.]|nr:hypothetical protein [Flavisolibacter sp.]
MNGKIKNWWYKLTHWEQWHYNVKYVLMSPVWIWYSIRARSFYFFTPANPTLTFGGFEGEPKKETYDLLPKDVCPVTIYLTPHLPLQKVEHIMAEAGLDFPIAAKPNIGMMGLLFRKIDNREQLAQYHQSMTAEYILQEMVQYPMEVSVFYYRIPGKEKGTITGFVRKEALEVVGNGTDTLETLMEQQLATRPGFKIAEWKTKHRHRLGNIVPAGEVFKLSWTANLSRGARLVNLEKEKDEQLLRV